MVNPCRNQTAKGGLNLKAKLLLTATLIVTLNSDVANHSLEVHQPPYYNDDWRARIIGWRGMKTLVKYLTWIRFQRGVTFKFPNSPLVNLSGRFSSTINSKLCLWIKGILVRWTSSAPVWWCYSWFSTECVEGTRFHEGQRRTINIFPFIAVMA